MVTKCPHCGYDIKERWHQRYGLHKFEQGSAEAGIPMVGKVGIKKETIVMVYVCDLTNLPFLVPVGKASKG